MGVALRGGGRVAAKDGDWIQKVDASIKGMRKDKDPVQAKNSEVNLALQDLKDIT